MIIQCPECNSLFNLKQKPSSSFCCPKCKYKAPFSEVLNQSSLPKAESDELATKVAVNLNLNNEATKVVNFSDKTLLVPGLQQQSNKSAVLQIIYKGVSLGKVTLPKSGNFNLGRRSSDSSAQIKIAPDMTMSRVHAAMRTMKGNDGRMMYQITTIKPSNPVYVNGIMIERGKICVLKTGDKIRLGETDLIFKLV